MFWWDNIRNRGKTSSYAVHVFGPLRLRAKSGYPKTLEEQTFYSPFLLLRYWSFITSSRCSRNRKVYGTSALKNSRQRPTLLTFATSHHVGSGHARQATRPFHQPRLYHGQSRLYPTYRFDNIINRGEAGRRESHSTFGT